MSETARETDRPRAGRSAANADPPGTVGELLAATEDSEEAEPEPGMERMREAAQGAAAQAEETGGLGRLGQPMNRRSPFFIGMAGAAGVAVTIGLVELVIRARSVLVIIGLALFIAVGMDPVVNWLTRRRVPRWAAVIIVLLGLLGVVGAPRPVMAPTQGIQGYLIRARQGHTTSSRHAASLPHSLGAVCPVSTCLCRRGRLPGWRITTWDWRSGGASEPTLHRGPASEHRFVSKR